MKKIFYSVNFRHLRFMLPVMLAALMTGMFVACGDDDDDSPAGGDTGSNGDNSKNSLIGIWECEDALGYYMEFINEYQFNCYESSETDNTVYLVSGMYYYDPNSSIFLECFGEDDIDACYIASFDSSRMRIGWLDYDCDIYYNGAFTPTLARRIIKDIREYYEGFYPGQDYENYRRVSKADLAKYLKGKEIIEAD